MSSETVPGFVRTSSTAPLKYPRYDEFYLPFEDRKYDNQFFKMYYTRLQDLRPRVQINAKQKWGNTKASELIASKQYYYCEKVLDIKTNVPCWVIGITYCDMTSKPNILDDVAIGAYGTPPPNKPSYSDPDSDTMMLEDESGRVELEGDFLKDTIFVTGNVIGCLGVEITAGKFKVLDIVYPLMAPQIERPLKSKNPSAKVAIVSGFEIDPENFNPLSLQILKEFLLGELDPSFANKISRLIIAGNSTKTVAINGSSTSGKKIYGTKSKSKFNSTAIKILDQFMSEIIPSIPVDLMPGDSDPAESIFPQQPISANLLQNSKQFLSTYSNISDSENESYNCRSITNPSWIQIDDIRILGTSGQNINDLCKYLVPNFKLENGEYHANSTEQLKEFDELPQNVLEATLLWQNIVPNCPDTLWTYPFQKNDPFTLDETPHVYFAGNQRRFDFKKLIVNNNEDESTNKEINVSLICVPKFKETGQIVLLDLSTLEAEVVQIC